VANLPITLWPGMKIGQLCLFKLTSPSEHPYGSAVYGSRYQGAARSHAEPVLFELPPLADGLEPGHQLLQQVGQPALLRLVERREQV